MSSISNPTYGRHNTRQIYTTYNNKYTCVQLIRDRETYNHDPTPFPHLCVSSYTFLLVFYTFLQLHLLVSIKLKFYSCITYERRIVTFVIKVIVSIIITIKQQKLRHPRRLLSPYDKTIDLRWLLSKYIRIVLKVGSYHVLVWG